MFRRDRWVVVGPMKFAEDHELPWVVLVWAAGAAPQRWRAWATFADELEARNCAAHWDLYRVRVVRRVVPRFRHVLASVSGLPTELWFGGVRRGA